MNKLFSISAIALSCLVLSASFSTRSQAQIITTYAGTGTPGHTGDGGAATAARIDHPHGNSIDGGGNIYICDYENNCIRKVTPAGIITNIVGTGVGGFTPDGAVAATAAIYHPFDVALDNAGNVYFCETVNQRVRKINTSGILSTVAGSGATGFTGDGGAATAAALSNPSGIAVDGAGNVYFTEQFNHVVRKVSLAGIITTVAGTGVDWYSGDGGPGTAAELNYPNFLAFDNAGNLLITDNGNHRIRKLTPAGIITTVVGNGSITFAGDGGLATAASLYYPGGVSVNGTGEIIIADNLHNRIRKVNAAGVISTVAGSGTAGYSGDGGLATAGEINGAVDVVWDASGNFYISDFENNSFRKVSAAPVTTNHPPTFNADGIGYVVACQNSVNNPIGFLDISDSDTGQTITYTILTGPVNGSVAGFPATTTSTGGSVAPTGVTYTPNTGYFGRDTFTVVVSDGYNLDTLPVRVDVYPNTAGTITGVDTLCIGDTAALLNSTTAGGLWSSSNTTVATVGGTGMVTALAAGTDSIYYSLTNTCFSGYVYHVVTVLTAEQCDTFHLAVNSIAPHVALITLLPNPNNGSFAITCPEADKNNVQITIADIAGRTVATYVIKNNRPAVLNIEAVPGIYFVTANNGVDKQTMKMVIGR